jgi:hypothetical protein
MDKAVVWVDEWPDELNELVGMPGPVEDSKSKEKISMLKILGNVFGIGSAGAALGQCQQLKDAASQAQDLGGAGGLSSIALIAFILIASNTGIVDKLRNKFAGLLGTKDEEAK